MANIVGCACDGSTKNTGYLGQKLFNIKTSIFIVPILAADGTRNFLDLTAQDLGAELLGKVNNADPTKRFYPLHEIKNFVPEQEDTQFATTNGGENAFLRKGIKSDTFELWGQSAQLFSKIEDFCFDFGIVEVDNCGNVRGYKSSATATELYPRPVNAQSYDARYMDAEDANVARIMVNYQFKKIDNQGKLWLVPAFEFGANSPLELKGLVDVVVEATPLTSMTIQLDVKGTFGDALNLIPIQGLVVANVTGFNVTDNSALVMDTLVADAIVKGRYVLTLTSTPTTADVLNLKVFRAAVSALTQGYEGEAKGIVSL
jgi:hypothetical protein